MRPDLILLGQTTVDHVVPARPGAWREQLGGNALYAAAGARLWIEPERIGVVTRVGAGCPFDPRRHLARGRNRAGRGRRYGARAARRVVPLRGGRVPPLPPPEPGPAGRGRRRGRASGPEYLAHLEAQSPSASDVPAEWLPAGAVHLAPQVLARHEDTLRTLGPRAGFVSVDPSPHYSAGRSVEALAHALAPATALPPERTGGRAPRRRRRMAEELARAGRRGGLSGGRGQARCGRFNPLRARMPAGPDPHPPRRSARSDGGGGRLLRRLRRLPVPGFSRRGSSATGDRRRLHGDRVRGGGRGPRPLAGRGPTAARIVDDRTSNHRMRCLT